jgi:hypothetical protein
MAKAKPRVSNISQAVKAYGGPQKFADAFNLSGNDLESWTKCGVPRAHHLGLYVGLQRRGYEPMAKLFGLKSWLECPGV